LVVSQENVDVAQRAIGAFNRREVDAFAALTTPDFEWSPSMGPIEGEIFRGADGIERYFENLGNAWDRFHILPDAFRDLPELVAMLGRLEGRGKGSGAPVDSPLGMVFDFHGGDISRIRGFLDHEQALRAAGLAE
jgi:ketosteroid isomerase-like protein